MKCVQIYGGETIRTSNENADALVDGGKGLFVSKEKWRARGMLRDGPQESIGKVPIHPPHGWVNTSNKKPRWAK